MGWETFVESLTAEHQWGQVFSCLTYLPEELARRQIQNLRQVGPDLPGRLAARRLHESLKPEDFALWAVPPWEELARRRCLEPLLEALHSDYATLSDVLLAHPDLTPELLKHLESQRWPALLQWVEENKPDIEQGQPGWRQAFLLTKQDLPLAELLNFLDQPRYRELACSQLLERKYQAALGAFLEAGREDFELLPAPQTPREKALERMLARGVVEKTRLAKACADQSEILADIWVENRYPSLAQWYQELTGSSLPANPADSVDEREAQWRGVSQLPVKEASKLIHRWGEEKFLPLHRPDLFDRAVALAEDGPILAVKVESRRLNGLTADRVFVRNDRVLGHQYEKSLIWSQGLEGEPRVVQSAQPLGRVGGVWETNWGFLLLEDNGLRMLGYDGQTLWHQSDLHGDIKLSPDGLEAAVTRPFGIVRISLSNAEILASGSFRSVEAAPPRSNFMSFVAMDSFGEGLDWSPDGRMLVTFRKESAFLWEASSLQLLHILEHRTGVTRVLFWGEGLLIVGGGQLGNTMFLGSPCHWWDPATGNQLKEFHPYGSVRAAFFDGKRLVNRYDSWPAYLEIFELGPDGPSSRKLIQLEGDDYRGEGGFVACSARGGTVLLKRKNGEHAIAGLGRAEPLYRWSDPGAACFLSADGSQLFSHSTDGLVVRKLYEERPAGELVPAEQSPTCREFLEILHEVAL